MLLITNISKVFINTFITFIMFAFLIITVMNVFSANSKVHAFSHPMTPRMTYNYELPDWVNENVFHDNKLPNCKKNVLEKYKYDNGYYQKNICDKVIEPYDYDKEFDYDLPKWVYKKVFRHNKTNYKKYSS